MPLTESAPAPVSGPTPAAGVTPPPGFDGPVVAIGASAGGLEALQRLFSALPVDTGAAFVVIQHLSPDHKSMMDDLLRRQTRMPVRMAEQGAPLLGDVVYLIPPGMTMHLAEGRLQLAAKPAHGLSLPIDIFFQSLAEQAGERALAVVLSGTGSDGSRGVVAISGHGGRVLVQDPASARFDGMPRSAVATGLAEVVAPVDELARQLLRLLHEGSAGPPDAPLAAALAGPMEAILDRLRVGGGVDFHGYKPRTVLRRMERRLQVLNLPTLDAYRQHLDVQPEELVALRRELLIPVTHFFRDADAFDTLARSVVRPLVQRLGDHEPVRVWVAACATGEEAYSIAMLFAEALAELGRALPLKIFATDVEPRVLEQANAGLYPRSVEADLTPERLARFFVAREDGWQVRSELRQCVVFARQNLVADPPFTRMHLVSCRNMLIYLKPATQERALQRLQYALVPQGHLFLGSSESLGPLQRNFGTVHARHRIYRLTHRDRLSLGLDLANGATATRQGGARDPVPGDGPRTPPDPALRLLTQAYLPPTLLVARNHEVLHVYGSAQDYLSLAEGQATLDVLRLLPRDLSWAAALLLRPAFADGQVRSSVLLKWGADERQVRLVARPLAPENGDIVDRVLLSFEPPPQAAGAADVAGAAADGTRSQVEALEDELRATQRSLQALIEELETSNEELQATNEELMASNEELQSTNEELQSVNEELYTVNAEFQEKVEQLNTLNADLENMSRAAAIPMVFVDEQLHLLHFSVEAEPLFKLREGDVGRSLEDFAHTLDYPDLFADLRQAIGRRRPQQREVRTADGRWWLARVQPYATLPKGSPRAVLSFIDIGSIKQFERLQAVLDSLPEHVALLDAQSTITLVNAAWRAFAAAQGNPSLAGCGPGANYLQVCANAALFKGADGHEDARVVLDGLGRALAGRLPSFSHHYPCDTPQGRLWFVLHAAPLRHEGGGAVVSHIDVTPWMAGGGEALA